MKNRNSEESLNELVDDVIGPRPFKHTPEYKEGMEKIFKDVFGESNPKEPPKKETLVVNLFAGPGTGKSTTCAGLFFELKNRHINCEMAREFAKDLVWEKRNYTFKDQIYLFAKQYHRIFCLLGQVDVVLTDCPILLSPVYDGDKRKTLEKLVVEEHNNMWTYNVFLKRKKKYNPLGRLHTETQAQEIDGKIQDMLDKHNQCYEVFDATSEGKDAILKKILLFLENKPSTLKQRPKEIIHVKFRK